MELWYCIVVLMPTSKGTIPKTHECPLCHELFAPAGLNGHLRMLHKIEREEAREIVRQVPEVPERPPTPLKDPEPGTLPIGLAVAGVSVLALGVLLALHTRNVVGCTSCGVKLDVSKARAEGAEVVRCSECGAMVQLP